MTDFTEMLTVTNKDLLYQIASECDKFIDYKCDRLTNIQNEYQEIYEHFSKQNQQNTEEDDTPPPPEEDFTYFPDDNEQVPIPASNQSVTQKGSPIIHNSLDNQQITPNPLPKTNIFQGVTCHTTNETKSQYEENNPHTPPGNTGVTQKGSAIIHKTTDNQPITSNNQPKKNNSASVTLPNNSNSNAKPTTNPTPNNVNPNIKKLGANPHRIGTKAWQDFNNLKARTYFTL